MHSALQKYLNGGISYSKEDTQCAGSVGGGCSAIAAAHGRLSKVYPRHAKLSLWRAAAQAACKLACSCQQEEKQTTHNKKIFNCLQ